MSSVFADTSGSLQQEASDSPQNSMGDLTLDIKEGTPERASQGRNLGLPNLSAIEPRPTMYIFDVLQ